MFAIVLARQMHLPRLSPRLRLTRGLRRLTAAVASA